MRLRAIDDYKIDLTKEEWLRWDILLATQTDGLYMDIKEKGPARIVFPYDTAKDIDPLIYNPKWIWQVKSIEFIEME